MEHHLIKHSVKFRIIATIFFIVLLTTGYVVAQSLLSGESVLTKAVTFVNTWTKNAQGKVTITTQKINYDYNSSVLKITQTTQKDGKSYYVIQSANQLNFKSSPK